ncbi:MAG: bifunctional UDP-N-acetylmuramoyl-tripeptide:D-alanyl-D-alanine ligase/alanine racemase, partial [Bacteroidetes bacterium]
SNGKTIIKEWLFQLMHVEQNMVRSPRSYNSQIGVPLSVFQMNEHHDLAIFEAGISQPGEMKTLKEIIEPTIGILTHMGTAHDEGFHSQEEKIKEKLLLFSDVEVLIVNEDAIKLSQFWNKQSATSQKIITWSTHHAAANLFISKIEKKTHTTFINGVYLEQSIQIRIPFTDDASVENAIYCWLLLLYLGYNQQEIAQRMERLHAITMRLEINEGINRCTIINDSYNSDIQSLSIALDVLNQQNQHVKKTVILSDILQGDKDKNQLYQSVAELLKKKNIHALIGIGEEISQYAHLFEAQHSFYHSTDDFLRQHSFHGFSDEAILLKGARTFTFEKINQRLQQKDHETVMEIDLSALIHNYNFYKKQLRKEVKIMAMVKAFSYGSGSYEVCNTLQFHHADYLAVAYADEGVTLRESGITLPIMVMNTEKHSFESILNYQLEPEIYNFRSLDLLIATCDRLLYNEASNPVKIHIKFDTGMKRLGFLSHEIPQLIHRIRSDK